MVVKFAVIARLFIALLLLHTNNIKAQSNVNASKANIHNEKNDSDINKNKYINNRNSFIGRMLQHKPYYYWFNEDNKNEKELLETTKDGEYPILSCPIGTYRTLADSYYRKPGGLRLDGCLDCPKGRYGAKIDLRSSLCSGACPRGRYRDATRGKSISDCFLCPEGTFGDREGLKTGRCSGYCTDSNTNSKKYYSNIPGLTTKAQCKACPPGYIGWQCRTNLRLPSAIAHEKND